MKWEEMDGVEGQLELVELLGAVWWRFRAAAPLETPATLATLGKA